MDKKNLKALVDALPLPSFLVTPEARIGYSNASAGEILGSNVEDRHYVTVLRQPGILETVEQAGVAKRSVTGQFSVASGGGARRFRVTASPMEFDHLVFVLVCLEDTTDSHDADQMRREFVANVSHELRTPLTSLMGFIDTLQDSAKGDPAAQEKFLAVMAREARRMNRLVDDLLSLSRVEFAERQRPRDALRVGDLIAAAQSALEGLVAADRVKFGCDTDTKELKIRGESDQLRQVFANLIENALKYGGENEDVHVNVSQIAHDPLLPGPALRIEVTDEGEGIASHHLPRLTERFYRVDDHRSREMGGTGLGLAIVKHIVQRHRGRLDVSSEPGQGSSFSVFLPLDEDGKGR